MIIAVYKDAQEHFDATFTAHAAARAAAMVHFCIYLRCIRRKAQDQLRASFSRPRLARHDVGCLALVSFFGAMMQAGAPENYGIEADRSVAVAYFRWACACRILCLGYGPEIRRV